jgi:hypothetical protein
MVKMNGTFLLQGHGSIEMETVQIELLVMDIGRALKLKGQSYLMRKL